MATRRGSSPKEPLPKMFATRKTSAFRPMIP